MKYITTLLFSIVLAIMPITDYIYKEYNIYSVIIIILAAATIFVMRKIIIAQDTLMKSDVLTRTDEVRTSKLRSRK